METAGHPRPGCGAAARGYRQVDRAWQLLRARPRRKSTCSCFLVLGLRTLIGSSSSRDRRSLLRPLRREEPADPRSPREPLDSDRDCRQRRFPTGLSPSATCSRGRGTLARSSATTGDQFASIVTRDAARPRDGGIDAHLVSRAVRSKGDYAPQRSRRRRGQALPATRSLRLSSVVPERQAARRFSSTRPPAADMLDGRSAARTGGIPQACSSVP